MAELWWAGLWWAGWLGLVLSLCWLVGAVLLLFSVSAGDFLRCWVVCGLHDGLYGDC